MSKTRDTGFLGNVVKVDASGNVSFVSGSTTLATINTTGQLSGSSPVLSASYASNAETLDGLDSTVFTLTSSFNAQTASFTAFTSSILSYTESANSRFSSIETVTGSNITRLSALEAATGSLYSYTSSLNNKTSSFATTGSNTFEGIQTINSNLIVTGSITAQTLVVQTITSSVDFVTGSTRFGSILGNTHVFSGSVTMNPGGLFVSSSGLVGIGTISPSYVLDVAAGSNGNVFIPAARITTSTGGAGGGTILQINHTSNSVSGLQILQAGASGGNYTSINNTENGYMSFSTSGSERMRITSTGSVGIGTTSPNTWATNLVVYDNQLTITGGGYDAAFADSIFFGGNSEGTNYRNKISNSLSSNAANQKMKFSVASGATTFADVMTLVGNGNVGIGTSTPSRKLIIQGGTSNAGLEILSANGYRSAIIAGRGSSGTASDQGYFQMTDQGTATVVLDTAGNSYVNGGNFGVKTTNPTSGLLQTGDAGTTSTNTYLGTGQLRVGGGSDHGGSTVLSVAPGVITFDRPGVAGGALTINPSGYVTLPAQPSFYIVSNGGQTDYTTNDVIIFNTARHNIGSHYNTSTGRFTAPVAGRYLFTLNVYAYPNYTAAVLLTINGAQYTGGGDVTPYIYTSSSADAKSISFTLIWELAASDYVEVRARSTTRIYRSHSHFSGCLLS